MVKIDCSLDIYDFKNFDLVTLKIDSKILKKNPLNDPSLRKCPILAPKEKSKKNWPVIFLLSGFSSNAPSSFSPRFHEKNTSELIDFSVSQQQAPLALYVFVDAMTYWGGSQFINSKAIGNYEDYIIKEIVPAIKKHFPVSSNSKHWCITGSSSGGYGALHLGSLYPNIFGCTAALAPDCFFEASLIPDMYKALPDLAYFRGTKGVIDELKKGKLSKHRNFHTIMNSVAMSLCYGGNFPLDHHTGLADNKKLKTLMSYDPIQFLPKRKTQLKKLNGLFLEVGRKDQFNLQLGARQIHQLLKKMKINHHYDEFDGGHFDLNERRPEVWKWLKSKWEQNNT